MRELTKSIGSFSWAMSLFGFRQMVDVLQPEKARQSFDQVTGATQQQLGDALCSTFRAGDRLQRAMVDMSFSMFGLDLLNPTRWLQASNEMVQRSGEALRTTVPTRPPGTGQEAGWGPMPRHGDHGAHGAAASATTEHRGAGAAREPGGWGPVPGG
jgi:hypothetical protein